MSLGRAQIPTEFQDTTSAMMLRQPLPQYPHAALIMAAVNGTLETASGMTMPVGGRSIAGRGAAYAQLSEQQLELTRAIAMDAITVIPDFRPEAKSPGHTVRFNRPKFASTTYTMQSRQITPGSVISKKPVNVSGEQVAVTVGRWGGPFDQVNGNVAPLSLSRFDSSRSIHDLTQIVGLEFQKDFVNTVDAFGVQLFDSVAAGNVVYAGTMVQDNDAVAVGDNQFDLALVLKTERLADEANIPVFASTRRRIMIISPYQAECLKRDSQYAFSSQQIPEMNVLYSGTYVGTCANFDILKSNTLSKPTNTSATPTPVHYGQAFGPGMVGVGPAGTPFLAPNSDDNYGEDSLAVWLWYCAFGVLDNRFGFSVRSS